MSEPDKELRKIEELEEQVNQALKRSRQLDEPQKYDENFFKQELKEMQERCQQNQQTMMRIEQRYLKPTDLRVSTIQSESPLQKSVLKQSRNNSSNDQRLEQKNAQILELQKKLLDCERVYQQRSGDDQIRIKQLECENDALREQLNKCEGLELQNALEDLQKQYLDLQDKLQETMRHDQNDYDNLKQEYEEYQLLTQNIVNQEEDYQRRICELEEELQQSHNFQSEFMSRMNKNEEIFQQRYRELKLKYQEQLDDQRRILDQQMDELREQNNYLFLQVQNTDKPQHYLGCFNKQQTQPSQQQQSQTKTKYSNFSQQSFNKPVKQINISIEKENLNDISYTKNRSFSKDSSQPVTYKQVAEQRQAILYSKLPKPRR